MAIRAGQSLELRRRDDALGGLFDGKAERRVRVDFPFEHPVDPRDVLGNTETEPTDKLGLGHRDSLEAISEIGHASFCGNLTNLQDAHQPIFCPIVQNDDMGSTGWKYRDVFDADYRLYRSKHPELTVDDIAKALNIATSTLNGYRRKIGSKNPPSTPEDDVVIRIAALFGHNDPYRYMDDYHTEEIISPDRKPLIQRAQRILNDPTLPIALASMLVDELATRSFLLKAMNR